MKRNLLHRSITLPRGLVALAWGAAAVLPILAQNGEPFRVGLGVGYRADADIDHHGGDFKETRFSVVGSRAFNVNEKLTIEPILSYRFSVYDFSKQKPWDDIHTFRATAVARYFIDDKWGIFGGPSIGVAAESDADLRDAITFGGAAGASYRFSPTLAVGAGVAVSSEIEDDARVRPLLIVNWQINDRWSFESGYTEVAGGGGPGGEIRYRIAEKWTVAGGAQYQEKRFRLSDSGSIRPRPIRVASQLSPLFYRVREGVGEDTSLPIYAKVTWQACRNAALEMVGGVAAGGELRLENRKGHKISEEDYDPAPLVGLRAILTF